MAKKPDVFWVSGGMVGGKRYPTITLLALYEDGHTEVLQELTEATPADLGFPDDEERTLSLPPATPEEWEQEKAKICANISKAASDFYWQGKLFPWQNGEQPPAAPPCNLALDFSDLSLSIRKAPA